METPYIPPTGALPSRKDSRTLKHDDMQTMASIPTVSGGYDYEPKDISHQHKEGICTAISLTQNAGKALGKVFSPDFQYLLQKRYTDGNWDEGSAILSALKVGKTYGFLPIELFTYVSEEDRLLPYDEYIAKLKAVPVSEVLRLIALCSDKLSGYAEVKIDTASIAKAISDSKSGIVCRYTVGDTMYTAQDGRISWEPKDIDPIRPPTKDFSGHAITMSRYNFGQIAMNVLANTWGTEWDLKGLCNVNFSLYKPTEAWIPYYNLTQPQKDEIQNKIEAAQKSLIVLLKQDIIILTQQLAKKLASLVK